MVGLEEEFAVGVSAPAAAELVLEVEELVVLSVSFVAGPH